MDNKKESEAFVNYIKCICPHCHKSMVITNSEPLGNYISNEIKCKCFYCNKEYPIDNTTATEYQF